MTKDDRSRADHAANWRRAFGDLVDRKRIERGLSVPNLRRRTNLDTSEFGRYTTGALKGSPGNRHTMALIDALEITPEDLAALPPYDGRARVTVPVRFSELTEVRTEVSAQTTLLLEIKASILAMQAPNPEADLAEARQAYDRTANVAMSPETRARLDQALNERRDGDALRIIAEQRAAREARMDDMRGEWQALNREGFAERMIEAGLLARARDWTAAIATYSAALRQPEGVELADLDRAGESRQRHVNFLAHREKTTEKAEGILFAPYDPPLGPNVFGYTILINMAGSPQESRLWYDAMVAAGVVPNEVTFSALIAKSGNQTQAQRWFFALISAGCQPDLLTMVSLIAGSESGAEADFWFDLMILAGLRPNVYVFSAMIDKADTRIGATRWFNAMVAAGTKPNVYSYTSMISTSETLQEAVNWLSLMEAAKEPPNLLSLTAMISKCRREGEAAPYFRRIVNAQFKPDLILYTTMINLCETLGAAYVYFKAMVRAQIKPDPFVLQVMIRKAETFAQVRDFLKGMRGLAMTPNLVAYARAIILANSVPEQHEIASWMMADHVQVDARFLTLLRRKGRHELADEFQRRGLVLP